MSGTPRWFKGLILLIAVVTIVTAACSNSKEDRFLGTYTPLPNSPPEYFDLYVELKKGGEGIRRVQSGEVMTFRWVVKGDEVRIHTKSGGTIVARLKGDLFEVRFPGPQVVYFKKIK
jgi:hypothetical protein